MILHNISVQSYPDHSLLSINLMFDSNNNEAGDDDRFKVLPVKGKGLGMVATSDLKPGEEILREKCLIQVIVDTEYLLLHWAHEIIFPGYSSCDDEGACSKRTAWFKERCCCCFRNSLLVLLCHSISWYLNSLGRYFHTENVNYKFNCHNPSPSPSPKSKS